MHEGFVVYSLFEKIKRTNIVTSIWKNALSPITMQYNTVGNESFLENGCYAIKSYEGQFVPNYFCSHIGHSVDITGDGKGDDELNRR